MKKSWSLQHRAEVQIVLESLKVIFAWKCTKQVIKPQNVQEVAKILSSKTFVSAPVIKENWSETFF